MPKVSPLQSNFNGGEFSPLLYGRVDADRYKAALKTCINYIPTIQGGLTRRPGTYFVADVKDSTKKARLQEFEFSVTQAYILEFGNTYIRVFKDNTIVTYTGTAITNATQTNPVVVTSVAHGLSNGDHVLITGVSGMTELNNREFTVANVTANTFELLGINGTTFTAYTSGGTVSKIFEVVSPYLEADLFDLKFTQSADVLYIVHPDYAPRKLTRTSDTSWTLTVITFLDGPYYPTNTTTTTFTPSAATGSITITASAVTGINNDTGFQSTDVGRLIRLKEGSNWGYVRITAVGSTTSITADVINTLTNTNAKLMWRLGLYSDTDGYPGAITFHEDRLILGGATGAIQRWDGSKSGDYENFAPTAVDGTVTDDNAISFTLNSNDVNAIIWITSDEKGMLIGTTGGEWVTKPASTSAALSPTNISSKKATSWGSENIAPVQAGKSTIFIQRAGRKLREMNYFYDVDGFRASDLTQLAEHISQTGFTQISYQKEPQSIIWCAKVNGIMSAMTYDRDLDAVKVGWARHIMGGISDAGNNDAIIESVAVIPSPDGTREEAWFIVKRYINGAVHRQIEYMTKLFEDLDEQRDAFFVDCGLTYDDPKTITAATQANPVVITAAAHGFSNGDLVKITDVLGMTELNSETFKVSAAAANSFALQTVAGANVDGTAYTTYVSGGEVRKLVSTISGINHLEGQTVSILGDGAVQPSKIVSHGRVTLSDPAGTVQVGLQYSSKGQLLRVEAGAADGTALGKTRRTHRVGFLLHRTLGFKIGTDFDDLDTITFRQTSDPLTRAPGLFTGVLSETIQADYDFENEICWQQDQPLPGMILAVMPQMVTQDR